MAVSKIKPNWNRKVGSPPGPCRVRSSGKKVYVVI